MANFSKKKKEDKFGKNFSDVHTGTTVDLLKKRAEMAPEIVKKAEELFEHYDGGGLVIVMQDYDENNNATGARMMVSGVDSVEGLVSLAEATHKASEEIIENIQQSGNPMAMMEAIMAMLKRKGHNHEDQ